MSEKSFFFLIVSILALLLVGCSTATPQETLLPLASLQTAAITPYYTEIPIQTTVPTATQAPTPTLPPLPTPTPYLYTVVQGDTMIGIAIYFGITYDELSLANPEVNPNFLSVGTQLVIPLPAGETDGDNGAEQAVPELLPLQTGKVNCYSVRSGGLWCYLAVTNPLEIPAENIAGLIRLYDNAGEEIGSQPAFSLLNLLAPGVEIPLVSYFAPPIPKWSTSQGQLVSAVEANQSELRYQTSEVTNLKSIPINEDRLGFQVSGSLILPSPAEIESSGPVLQHVWVLAIGYDDDGEIVGLRRWETPVDQMGEQLSFSFQVFSLGKPIETVVVLTEVKTRQP